MADKTTKIIEIEVELEGGEKVTKQFEKLSDDELRSMITRDLIIGIKTLSKINEK